MFACLFLWFGRAVMFHCDRLFQQQSQWNQQTRRYIFVILEKLNIDTSTKCDWIYSIPAIVYTILDLLTLVYLGNLDLETRTLSFRMLQLSYLLDLKEYQDHPLLLEDHSLCILNGFLLFEQCWTTWNWKLQPSIMLYVYQWPITLSFGLWLSLVWE